MERWFRALDVTVTRMWPFAAGPLLFDRRTWHPTGTGPTRPAGPTRPVGPSGRSVR